MHQDRFIALKNIDAFTTEMFNRIIAFQEKHHPAWNPELEFASRIQGLPLHNLIFSNPDRDPNRNGPTVAPYYPLREEMVKLAHYVRQVSKHPLVLDWFPGNGFIGSLLARENVRVMGLSLNNVKPNQIESFFDPDCYEFCDDKIPEHCDMVLASWIPANANPTPTILSLKPKIIVYVYTEHRDPATRQRQTGSDDMFDNLLEEYRLLDTWSITRPRDLLHEIWPDMTPNIEELRITKVYIANQQEFADIVAADILPQQTHQLPYDWEKELQFALLALEAKNELRSRGLTV